MKRMACCLLLFFLALKTQSQKKDYFSFEADAYYYYYLMGKYGGFSNKFNYGFSLHVAKYLSNKLKISFGINYYTKSLVTFDNSIYPYDIKRREYYLDYRSFPLLFHIETVSKKRFSSSIVIGFALSYNKEYRVTSYYINGTKKIEELGKNDGNVLFILGNSFSIPLGNPKPLEDRLTLNIMPFVNYKLLNNFNYDPKLGYQNIPQGLQFGVKVGIEYLFRLPYLEHVDYP